MLLLKGSQMKPRVSIIIPSYNEERYIGECIDSVLQQTLCDFEVLCVDNGSSDSTIEILEGYAKRDSRIHVLSSGENAGAARNVGLEAAQGKYLFFLDSDDFIAEDLLDEAVRVAEESRAEIVLFGGSRYNDKDNRLSDKTEFISYRSFPKNAVFSAEEAPGKLFQLTSPSPWSKLFLRSYIIENDLRFQSLANSNDLFFTYAALSLATRITGIDKSFVRHRTNKDDSSQTNKADAPLCFFSALKALDDFLIAKGRDKLFADTLKRRILSTAKCNLSTSSTDDAKRAIFEYLIANWNGWLGLDWQDGDERYSKKTNKLRGYLLSAIDWFKKREAVHPVVSDSLECMIPRRSEGGPFVSAIVPAYNVGSFIGETLQSLANQTFQNIEIICIDDGSTDDTLQRLLDYAEMDARISVYHQRNSGLSMARNAGLRLASGDYVYFIDGDDLLLPETFAMLHRTITSDGLDAVFFDADSFCREGAGLEDEIAHYGSYYHRKGGYEGVFSGLGLLNSFVGNGDYLPSACLYMAKRELLESYDAHFIPAILHEDNDFTFQLMLNAHRTKHMPQRFYLRRVRRDSIMVSPVCFEKVYGYFICIEHMLSALLTFDGQGVSAQELFGAHQVVMNAMASAQREYRQLPDEEIGAVLSLSKNEGKRFARWIASEGNRMRMIDKKDEEIEHLKEKNEKLRNSLMQGERRNRSVSQSMLGRLRKKLRAYYGQRANI